MDLRDCMGYLLGIMFFILILSVILVPLLVVVANIVFWLFFGVFAALVGIILIKKLLNFLCSDRNEKIQNRQKIDTETKSETLFDEKSILLDSNIRENNFKKYGFKEKSNMTKK
jgi:uncharacterized protein YacL